MAIVVITVALLLCLNGVSGKVGAKIIGGEYANEGQFPYMASLQYGKTHVCGGTIYDERNIVTAAHCCTGLSLGAVAGCCCCCCYLSATVDTAAIAAFTVSV